MTSERMRPDITLVTGSNGEIGQALLRVLDSERTVALDIKPLDTALAEHCLEFVQGDILDKDLTRDIGHRYKIRRIFHLAAVLSTKAEDDPLLAHKVNVEGTLNLLLLGAEQGTQFIFPSSFAVYGLPDLETKNAVGPINEDVRLAPETIYGANKLYCEHLGRLFSDRMESGLDFRALRFPGLISAETMPSGGTTDYGPEMLHFAAAGRKYPCFVRPDTVLPFMTMPDAVRALLGLAEAAGLPRRIYNAASFSASAEELRQQVVSYFPDAEVTFEPDERRQAIVDSWPAELDDRAAREEWGWLPELDLDRAFAEYLIPAISEEASSTVRRV